MVFTLRHVCYEIIIMSNQNWGDVICDSSNWSVLNYNCAFAADKGLANHGMRLCPRCSKSAETEGLLPSDMMKAILAAVLLVEVCLRVETCKLS